MPKASDNFGCFGDNQPAPHVGALKFNKQPALKIMNAVVSSPTAAPVAGMFTLHQVARMLAVSRRTLEREHARGRLKFVRIGRSIRIKAEDLAAYTAALPAAI